MAFTYREIMENIADAEERLKDATTEYEYEMALNELEELYVQRDAYDIESVGEESPLDDILDDIRANGF